MSLYDLIIRNGNLVTSATIQTADLAIADGRIVAIAESPLADRKKRAAVRRNVETAIQKLNDLGVVVDEWPTR